MIIIFCLGSLSLELNLIEYLNVKMWNGKKGYIYVTKLHQWLFYRRLNDVKVFKHLIEDS